MPRPEHYVFFCCHSRGEGHPRGSCATKGANDLFNQFMTKVTAKNLHGRVGLARTECLGPCNAGANILVYPEGTLYIQVTPDQLDKIIDDHLINGKPVEEFAAPAELW